MLNEDILNQGAAIIKAGGLVAFPTETVYGLGADALNPLAVAKIFAVKKRPYFDPLIIHIAQLQTLDHLILKKSALADTLIRHFWPGPLTLIFKKNTIVPDLVTAGFDSVAIRMPDHPIALTLIKKAQCPIAAPSANPFGRLSPTEAHHVEKYLGNSVDLIIDGGKCQKGLESTIIDITQDIPVIVRTGSLTIEAIEKVIGCIEVKESASTLAPGNLAKHYAPRTKLILLEKGESIPQPQPGIGYLIFGSPSPELLLSDAIALLSPTGDLTEAAANFFTSLHRLDEMNLHTIYATPIPHQGLGQALMERLTKAANTFIV